MNTYTCYYQDCQKTYNSKYNLIRHLNSYHLDNKSYMCSFCNKGFYNKQCLTSHMSTRQCELPSGFVEGRGLVAHLSYVGEDNRQQLSVTPALNLPVLPRIEKDRQIPFPFAKLPITPHIFDQNREVK